MEESARELSSDPSEAASKWDKLGDVAQQLRQSTYRPGISPDDTSRELCESGAIVGIATN
jgi:hypothetical protein